MNGYAYVSGAFTPPSFAPSYSSFKSLPEALSREQLHPEGQHLLPEAVNGAAGGDAKTKDDACKLVSEISETTCFSSLP